MMSESNIRFGRKNRIWIWQIANCRNTEPVVPREDYVCSTAEQTPKGYTTDKSDTGLMNIPYQYADNIS